jgi:hypothetical protein
MTNNASSGRRKQDRSASSRLGLWWRRPDHGLALSEPRHIAGERRRQAGKTASEVLDKNGSMTIEQCYNSMRIELWMTKGMNWTILK